MSDHIKKSFELGTLYQICSGAEMEVNYLSLEQRFPTPFPPLFDTDIFSSRVKELSAYVHLLIYCCRRHFGRDGALPFHRSAVWKSRFWVTCRGRKEEVALLFEPSRQPDPLPLFLVNCLLFPV